MKPLPFTVIDKPIDTQKVLPPEQPCRKVGAMASPDNVTFGRAMHVWGLKEQGSEAAYRTEGAWQISGRSLSGALALLSSENKDVPEKIDAAGIRPQETTSSENSLATSSSTLPTNDGGLKDYSKAGVEGSTDPRKRSSARKSRMKSSIFAACFS